MGIDHPVVTSARLIPRWYVAIILGVLTLLTGAFVGLALTSDGVAAAAGWGLTVGAGSLLVAAASAFVRPRRPREPLVTADGTRVFLSPALTAWGLVVAWLALLVVAGLWVVQAITDFGSIESPGFAFVTVMGAVGSLPDLSRLLRGRLHRWRLEVGPQTLRYRGYHTDVSWPWAKIHGAALQARGPAGVLVDLKGAGVDPVIPVAAFSVPAEQLIEEIERGKAAARPHHTR